MGSATLIVNPYASRVTPERIAAVRAALPHDARVVTTERRGHAAELAREAVAAGHDTLYVLSGDGVFNEVLNGIDASTTVAFLPGGATNVLARALGLPRDPVDAARKVARGRRRRISVGRVNGRRFGFSAGIGFDAELVRRVDALGRRTDGRRPGDAAFAWLTTRMIVERRGRFDAVLELEGLGRAAFAMVANCDPYTYAGPVGLHAAPRARFELGLDVFAPRSVRPLDVPRLLAYLARGRGLADGRVLLGHDLDRLVVRCDLPLPLHVDGEDLGDVTEATIVCERDAVTVLA